MSQDVDNNYIPSSLLLSAPHTDQDIEEVEEQKIEKKIIKLQTVAEEIRKESDRLLNIDKLREKLERLIQKHKNAKVIRNIDKVMFVFGLARLVFEAFLLGKAPCSFPTYYSILVSILVFIRFLYYRWMRWHYFLIDFCYWANLLTIVFLMYLPHNEFLFHSIYAFSMGPLLLAIPIFRNSLVIHSLEKATSVFIHLSPGFALWAIKSNNCEKWPVTTTIPTLSVYFRNAIILYLIWAIIYYIIIFKITFERCEKKKNVTLFRYHLEDKNGLFYKLSGLFGEKLRPITFMSVHMIFSLFTLLFTYLTLYSSDFQLCLLVLTTLLTFWTAANYYMEIFSKNYELKLQQLEKLKESFAQSKKKN